MSSATSTRMPTPSSSAVGNAVLDVVGVNVDENPITPEKVWQAIKAR